MIYIDFERYYEECSDYQKTLLFLRAAYMANRKNWLLAVGVFLALAAVMVLAFEMSWLAAIIGFMAGIALTLFVVWR